MVDNLQPDNIYQCIVSDFIGAWDSIAANPDENIGRGNFMFARQAMSLEFTARLYRDDSKFIRRISKEFLYHIEPKYFTLLPSVCAENSEFVLPHMKEAEGNRTLLWAIFDLIRHGLAHQYQQVIVDLNDKKRFYILLTGAIPGRYLSIAAASRPQNHLAYRFDEDADLELILYSESMFLDFKNAIEKSAFIKPSSGFEYLSRPKRAGSKKPPRRINYYDFGMRSLEDSLKKGGHIQV